MDGSDIIGIVVCVGNNYNITYIEIAKPLYVILCIKVFSHVELLLTIPMIVM